MLQTIYNLYNNPKFKTSLIVLIVDDIFSLEYWKLIGQ